MHYYLYDKGLSNKKFEGTLTKIEQRLIELGINGHIEKLSVLKSIPNLIQESILRGANTIVVVGSDATLLQVVESIGNFKQAVLGFIPMDENSRLAPLFGIPLYEDACDVLSMRITERIDLGVVNDNFFFLGSLEIPPEAQIEYEGPYTVQTKTREEHLSITNLGRVFVDEEAAPSSVTDAQLEACVVREVKRGLFRRSEGSELDGTHIPFTHARIISPHMKESQVKADQVKSYPTPIDVRIAPGQLKLIVGKARQI